MYHAIAVRCLDCRVFEEPGLFARPISIAASTSPEAQELRRHVQTSTASRCDRFQARIVLFRSQGMMQFNVDRTLGVSTNKWSQRHERHDFRVRGRACLPVRGLAAKFHAPKPPCQYPSTPWVLYRLSSLIAIDRRPQ